MREAVQQGAQIKSGASHHHWQAAAPGDFCNGLAGDAGVLTCGVTVRGIQHVQQVMRYPPALRFGRLGGADVEAAIELEGIAIDDLA